MDSLEGDETQIISSTDSKIDMNHDSNSSRFTYRRSTSLRIPENFVHSSHVNISGHTGPLRNDRQSSVIQMTGPSYASNSNEPVKNQNEWMDDNYGGKKDHLLRSGQLRMCNDPYCTTCPSYYHPQGHRKISKSSDIMDQKLRNRISGEAKNWGKRVASFLHLYTPPVMNPHTKIIQHWNQFFVISCLFSIFLDPLFFFLLSVQKPNNCIVRNHPMTTTIVVLRSCTDFVYLMHLLLQFQLAYVAPESRVVGAGELVYNPRKIALNYLSTYFWIDLILVLPIPQMIVLVISPDNNSSSGANYGKNLFRAAILLQYVPRFYRFFPFLAGQSPTGFIFESGWANFVINILTFILTSHVVGSSWYLFGLQRVNQCLRDACHMSNITKCTDFIDCGHGTDYSKFASNPTWDLWKNNSNATACFGIENLSYGIYVQAVNLTTKDSLVTRYMYSLFWGFQQISTLAGNQVPSYFVWEVLFTMLIIGLGLLLFALLIGNMQNFLQSLGRRRLGMYIRRRDVELWMSHRRLPVHLRKKVRQAEHYNWAATRGVNEEMLLKNLPEDLQQEIRKHLFEFIKKVRIFAQLDEPVLDSIRERLRQTTYIKENKILYPGGFVDKMVFIVRGETESIGEDGIAVPLSEGDVCGEELLTWCLELTSVNKDLSKRKNAGYGLVSNRLVRCLTNVEAFVLRVEDIEQVTSLFARFFTNPRVQGALRAMNQLCEGMNKLCDSTLSSKVFDDNVGYESTFMCDICVDEKPKSAGFHITGCDHSYCSDCVAMYVTTQLEENVSTIKCPNVGCEVKLDPQHCTTILTPQVFDKWCDALCEALVESSSERFYCPFKDCSVLLINDSMTMLMESECPECHRLFCAQCRVGWHSDVSCEEYKKMDKNQIERDDKLLVKLANDNQWKRCPNCSYYVEKSSGCLFMTCRCKCKFCYQCGYEAKDHYCKNCKQLNTFT